MPAAFNTAAPPGMDNPGQTCAVLIRDSQSCLPLSRNLRDGDLVILLTPVVAPISPARSSPAMTSDPFEPLGRALARHHPWIRHVPYTVRGGITGTHVAFIKRAAVVIFVISGPACQGQPSQVELSGIARTVGGHRLQVIAACCNIQELGPLDAASFPTVIQLPGYSSDALESAADLLFRVNYHPQIAGPNAHSLMPHPKTWPVEIWNAYRDVTAIHDLWLECLPGQFHLDRLTLQYLLVREGCAMHYVVREPETADILGFCATYTTYIDSGSERLIGSLSAILVRPSSRRLGIGSSLHDHALRQLAKTRGVCRLQLGSTFPRLLYGPPSEIASHNWFGRRGWRIDQQGPGTGQDVCDWILRIDQWPSRGFLSSNLSFRPCSPPDFDLVLEMVGRESARKDSVGWYDQYAKLANTMHLRDIVVGVENETIVAAALTYVKNSGSPVAEDLPWAATISDDVGGVTCICITGKRNGAEERRTAR